MNSDCQFKPGDLIEVFDASALAKRLPYPVIHPYHKQRGVVIKTCVVGNRERASSFDLLMSAISGKWLVKCLIDEEIVSIEPEYIVLAK